MMLIVGFSAMIVSIIIAFLVGYKFINTPIEKINSSRYICLTVFAALLLIMGSYLIDSKFKLSLPVF